MRKESQLVVLFPRIVETDGHPVTASKRIRSPRDVRLRTYGRLHWRPLEGVAAMVVVPVHNEDVDGP